jgi:lysyl oxidase/Big-like domain-containing protein
MVAGGTLAAPGDEPNLQAQLETQYAPSVDTATEPGHVLLRFDSVIQNRGPGNLNIYRQAGANGQTYQYSGTPASPPASGTPLPTLAYSFLPGHDHWHFPQAAEYRLLDASGNLVAPGAKNTVGFCLYDSFGPTGVYDPADGNWCRPGSEGDTSQPTQMGISAGSGDYYFASLAQQWIDVTGIAPGAYTLWMKVNPTGSLTETTTGDNVDTMPVTVPGAIATPATASTSVGTPVSIPVSGQVVGGTVPWRIDASCNMFDAGCFRLSNGNLGFVVSRNPANGTAAVVGGAGTAATIRYTPRAGFSGTDSFSFTTADSRGLTSAPATVTVTVAGSPPPSSTPTTPSGPGSSRPGGATASKRPSSSKAAASRSLKVSIVVPRRVALGHRGKVTIRLSKASKGSKVRVLARHGSRGKWATVASGKFGKKKTITLTLKRLPRGTYTLKVAIRSGHTTKFSAAKRLTVARPV